MQNIQFGLARRGSRSLCGNVIHATEHPQLYIFETAPNQGFATKRTLEVEEILLSAYVNTKFAHLSRHIKNQIQSLHRDSVFHRCTLDRQIILNSITQMKDHLDMFALAVIKQTGFTAVPAEEVAHLIQCRPVNCRIRSADFCYEEMAGTCENHTLFMRPITKILVPLGTPPECNGVLSTMFEVNGA